MLPGLALQLGFTRQLDGEAGPIDFGTSSFNAFNRGLSLPAAIAIGAALVVGSLILAR